MICRTVGLTWALASVATLAASQSSFAANVPAGSAPSSMTKSEVLQELHSINLAEIAAGHMAEKRGSNQAVRSYGKMLVSDHRADENKVKALAHKDNITLDPTPKSADVQQLDEKLATMSRELNQANKPSFDALFATKMVAGHDDAIHLVEEARQTFDSDADMKNLADGLLPQLRKHRDDAARLMQRGVAH